VVISAGADGLKFLRLPLRDSVDPRAAALRLWPDAVHAPRLLPALQAQISQYFQGRPTEFDVQLDLGNRSNFQQDILQACRTIPFAKTMTYAQLAELGGYPRAARAVGSVMAGNPMPLVIPCHRVVGAGGGLGGFSSPGGVRVKKRLLELEARASHSTQSVAC